MLYGCPFEKNEKEFFFRLTTFFFRNKKFFFREQLQFSFLCITIQKKISERSENFWKFLFLKIYFIKNVWKVGFQLMLILGRLGMYVLWCCVGICHEVLTFFQIGYGHSILCYYSKAKKSDTKSFGLAQYVNPAQNILGPVLEGQSRSQNVLGLSKLFGLYHKYTCI